MTLSQRLRRYSAHPALLIGLTLVTGGLFKLSAFAREAFIAARFGLSSVTDTYFGLQQFPITLATFMFGSFALAFTPAYAAARNRGQTVAWLPGLTAYGLLAGTAMTALMLAFAPWLLQLFTRQPDSATWNTLAILSLCYVPIFCIGVWSGICTAQGHNIWAMSMTGLPYLVMTLTLLALYATHTLNNLGLPISMGVGFCLVGAYAFARILRSSPGSLRLHLLGSTWKMPEFRAFLRELSASSIENMGYAANQLLILFFLARAGTGAISANNCGMRIGMLGFSLLAQPLAQLVQAKLCGGNAQTRPVIFRQWFLLVASGVVLMALALFALRVEVIRAVYMHGKFQNAELNQVASILPAWIGYFIVLSLNAVVARYLFTDGKGTTYVRRQLSAYAAANIFRLALAGSFGAPMIIWCSVAAESVGLILNIRTCLSGVTVEAAPAMALPGEA